MGRLQSWLMGRRKDQGERGSAEEVSKGPIEEARQKAVLSIVRFLEKKVSGKDPEEEMEEEMDEEVIYENGKKTSDLPWEEKKI